MDTSAYTDTQYPIGGDADMGCCMLCVFTVCNTTACVCSLLTAAAVEGCRVSRGMVLNGSVVTSQVQLLFLLSLCCTCCYTDQKHCMFGVSECGASVGGLCVNSG